MISTRTFFYFAFTYRFFFTKESGPAKFENDVLTTDKKHNTFNEPAAILKVAAGFFIARS
jgi:hypothetical protein